MVLSFTNPIAPHGADPWIIKSPSGDCWYYCRSHGTGVTVARLESPHLLSQADEKLVYTAPEGTMWSKEYWAPELHYINDHWYIYVAADDGSNDNHRMYVLCALSDDPCGQFEMVGKIGDSSNKWAIDGTVLQWNNRLYFIWSGWEGDNNIAQNLYIAEMSDPFKIIGKRHLISKPELDWECRGGSPLINEGPCALECDGKLFIVYSASGSWCDDYCLGTLIFNGNDPLDSNAWVKHPQPILSKASRSFGPGHCSFTCDTSNNLFVIYHANLESGTSWRGRSVRIQPAVIREGIPFIGEPAVPGKEIEINI